jgi:hypothetical protein
MKTFLFTSTQFEGEVVFIFNDENLLIKYDTTGAKLSAVQLDWLTAKLPKTLNRLKDVLKASRGAKLTEQKQASVTCEMFWCRADGRARFPSNSSKKRAQKRWQNMPQRERDKAYNFLETYLRQIPDGLSMMYAETYLNKELWNN